MKELKLGIAGLGVVAQGLLNIVKNNGQLIAERTGILLKVVRVASRSEKPEIDLLGASFSMSVEDLWQDSDVDVVVELMGDDVEPRREFIKQKYSSVKNLDI